MVERRRYKPLEEYGFIGNLETCALVGSDGSIDWYCYPHLESSSVFAALLDSDKGGAFSLRPSIPFESHQSYRQDTNVLLTTFRTSKGTLEVLDFMPLQGRDNGQRHENIELAASKKYLKDWHGGVSPHVPVSRLWSEMGAKK